MGGGTGISQEEQHISDLLLLTTANHHTHTHRAKFVIKNMTPHTQIVLVKAWWGWWLTVCGPAISQPTQTTQQNFSPPDFEKGFVEFEGGLSFSVAGCEGVGGGGERWLTQH